MASADTRQHDVADDDVPIRRRPFPFAERTARSASEHTGGNHVGREVVTRLMAGLERAYASARLGNHDTVMLDPDLRITGLGDCRAWEIPHAAPGQADWILNGSHAVGHFTFGRAHKSDVTSTLTASAGKGWSNW